MNQIYAQRLAQIVGREGVPEPATAQELERRLAVGEQPTPPPARALAVLLETKAVDYLRRWHAHAGEKVSYAEVRTHIADKLAQSALLDVPTALWALDAWYAALVPPAAAPAAALGAPATPDRHAPPPASAGDRWGAAAAAEPAAEDEPAFDARGVARPAGDGWQWALGAWRLFARAWPRWLLAYLLMGLVLGAVLVAIGAMAATVLLLPVAALAALLFVLGLSLFYAGLLRCAQRVDQDGRFQMSDLFYGFSHRIGAQLGAALLWILVWVAVAALAALALVLVFNCIKDR